VAARATGPRAMERTASVALDAALEEAAADFGAAVALAPRRAAVGFGSVLGSEFGFVSPSTFVANACDKDNGTDGEAATTSIAEGEKSAGDGDNQGLWCAAERLVTYLERAGDDGGSGGGAERTVTLGTLLGPLLHSGAVDQHTVVWAVAGHHHGGAPRKGLSRGLWEQQQLVCAQRFLVHPSIDATVLTGIYLHPQLFLQEVEGGYHGRATS
jgi:hypothetical protein